VIFIELLLRYRYTDIWPIGMEPRHSSLSALTRVLHECNTLTTNIYMGEHC